ncbi:hypothetical protein C8Q80DRAFT_1122809 [Daedaleopsis nitida]|nr:hypothetical protein C8Q80DRAFT_1122809 [Daedaleopsis nitida]
MPLDAVMDTSNAGLDKEMTKLAITPTARIDDDELSGVDSAVQNNTIHSPHTEELLAAARSIPASDENPLPTKPPFTAFVGNLAYGLTEEDINEFFGGKTRAVKLVRNKRQGQSKGYGYVDFNSVEDLRDALEDSDLMLAGRPIRVAVAKPRKERMQAPKKDGPAQSGDSAAPLSQPSGSRARQGRTRSRRFRQRKGRAEECQDNADEHANKDRAELEVAEDHSGNDGVLPAQLEYEA